MTVATTRGEQSIENTPQSSGRHEEGTLSSNSASGERRRNVAGQCPAVWKRSPICNSFDGHVIVIPKFWEYSVHATQHIPTPPKRIGSPDHSSSYPFGPLCKAFHKENLAMPPVPPMNSI